MDIAYWLLEYELDQLSRYLDLVKNALQNYGQEIAESYDVIKKEEMTQRDIAFLEADYDERFIEAGRDFPQLLLSSFIISWYSLVEKELLNLCEQLKLKISIGPKDNEYFDKGIRRARKFLIKGKSYEIDSPHWQELVNIGKLRNQIVHAGNRIYCSYDEIEGNFVSYVFDGEVLYISVERSLFDYLKKHNLFEISSPPAIKIMPSYDYCHHLVKFGKDFFYKLHEELKPGSKIMRSRHT